MASSFLAIALLLASRVRKDIWQLVETAPWDKFSPDHLVGVIPDDLNFDASLFPCCSDHRPRFPSMSRRTTLISSSTSSLVSSLPNPSAEALAREHVAQATSEYGFAFL